LEARFRRALNSEQAKTGQTNDRSLKGRSGGKLNGDDGIADPWRQRRVDSRDRHWITVGIVLVMRDVMIMMGMQ